MTPEKQIKVLYINELLADMLQPQHKLLTSAVRSKINMMKKESLK